MAEESQIQQFVATGIAVKRLGVCAATLRKWAKRGFIQSYRSDAGKFFFDVDEYLARRRAAMAMKKATEQPHAAQAP